MALPKVETFTDADFTPLATHDANWTQIGGVTALVDIYHNAARNDTALSSDVVGAKWDGDAFGADQSSEIVVATVSTPASLLTLGAFVRGSGTGGGFNGYMAWVYKNDLNLYLYRCQNTTLPNQAIGGPFGAISSGDTIKLWAVGSAIHLSINGTEVSGSPFTDTNIDGTGGTAPGFVVSDFSVPVIDTITVDNVGGGAPSPTAGPLVNSALIKSLIGKGLVN